MTNTKLHATFGASKSTRWLSCPGSIRLEALCPPQETNIYAAEGTLAHECMEKLLLEEITKEWAVFEYGEDIVEKIETLTDYVKTKQSYSTALYVEEKVDCSDVFEQADEFGTVDVALYTPRNALEIIDYKHGKSVVEVENNTQLLYYAIGMSERFKYNFKTITMTVVQPRAYHAAGAVRSWTISVKELKKYINLFKDGIQKCREPDAPTVAGKWCYWCPAKMVCPSHETKKQSEMFELSEEIQDGKEESEKESYLEETEEI